MIIVDLYFFC